MFSRGRIPVDFGYFIDSTNKNKQEKFQLGNIFFRVQP